MKRSERRFLTLGGTLGLGGRAGGVSDGGRRPGRVVGGLGRLGLVAVALASAVALGAVRAAAADPAWIEATYARRIAPAISLVLTSLSGRLPFSLAEIVVLSLPLIVAYRFARAFAGIRAHRSRRTFGRRTGRRPNLAAEMGYLTVLMLFGAATFYGSWGLNYARPPLERRLGWAELRPLTTDGSGAGATVGEVATTTAGMSKAPAGAGDPNPDPNTDAVDDAASQAVWADARELTMLAEQLVHAANRSYVRLHGAVDIGRPSALSVRSIAQPIAAAALVGEPRRVRHTLDEALDAGYAVAADELGLPPDVKLARGPAKAVAASTLMSRLGLAGFYFPWTGEANYNRDMPAFQLPHTIAHEKAHQRGIGGEDEANFLAYVAGLRSPSLFARYSAQTFGQRQLLRELIRLDAEAGTRLIEARHAGVQRDVDAANAYWRRFEGRPAELQREANDAYLRFNGDPAGIEAYARSARLIVLYARASGGRAMGYLAEPGLGLPESGGDLEWGGGPEPAAESGATAPPRAPLDTRHESGSISKPAWAPALAPPASPTSLHRSDVAHTIR